MKNKKCPTQVVRQGDVLLVPVEAAPAKLSRVKSELKGRHVLAHGEATGHHHSVDASAATLVQNERGERFLKVKKTTPLEHQEHAPLWLQENEIYRVIRQREFTPTAPGLTSYVRD